MSLYSRLFSENPNADELLAVLGMTRADFGRYRDIFATPHGRNIIVYARIGGKNKPYFENAHARIAAHPWFDHGADERTDNTYFDIRFKVPVDMRQRVKLLSDGSRPLTPWERFEKLHLDEESRLVTPDTQRSKAFAKEFAPKLQEIAQGNSLAGIFDSDTPEDLKSNVETIDV